MKIQINQKGQSLVEVTVALSLLAVVFTGVVTLAANAVGLMVYSRMKTEATAFAQEGLENFKGDVGNSCLAVENTGGNFVDFPTNPVSSVYARQKKIEDPPPALPAADYALLTVLVKWDVKGQPGNEIEIKQIIKRK